MGLTKEDFKSNMRKLISEFIGTMMLILTIQMSVGAGEPLAALGVSLLLMVQVYSLGPVSGCNINPVVSLALYVRGDLVTTELIMFWIAQFGGGFVGALVGKILNGESVHPSIGEGHNFLQAFLSELIFTAFFIFSILMVAPKTGAPQPTFGITIGMSLFVCIIAIGSISGASLNPAVICSLVLVNNLSKLHYALWIAGANASGSLIGTFLYFLLHDDDGETKLTPEEIMSEMQEKLRLIGTNSANAEGEEEPLLR